jgi:hypothetical protein
MATCEMDDDAMDFYRGLHSLTLENCLDHPCVVRDVSVLQQRPRAENSSVTTAVAPAPVSSSSSSSSLSASSSSPPPPPSASSFSAAADIAHQRRQQESGDPQLRVFMDLQVGLGSAAVVVRGERDASVPVAVKVMHCLRNPNDYLLSSADKVAAWVEREVLPEVNILLRLAQSQPQPHVVHLECVGLQRVHGRLFPGCVFSLLRASFFFAFFVFAFFSLRFFSFFPSFPGDG